MQFKKASLIFKSAAALISAVLIFGNIVLPVSAEPEADTAAAESFRAISYENYLKQYSASAHPAEPVEIICAGQYSETEEGTETEVKTGLGGKAEETLTVGDSGSVTFSFDVAEAGLYNIVVDYYPVEGKGGNIERSLLVNGELPFEEARALFFSRIFTDVGEKKYSKGGNEYRRDQVEAPQWVSSGLRNTKSYLDEYFACYFEKGQNTVTLVSVSEPIALSTITLCQMKSPKPYAEVRSAYEKEGLKEVDTSVDDIVVQAEEPSAKSSATFYALSDRTSPENQPFSVTNTLLNSIGGMGWQYQGDWMEWDVYAETEGLYKLSFRAKQNYKSGAFSTRSIFINDEIPFSEAADIRFVYSNKWQMVTASDSDEQPYLFHLKKGPNTIRMEVALGGYSEILRALDDSVNQLSSVYRKVIMLTGSMPDSLRDYKLDKTVPDIFPVIKEQINVLSDINEKIIDMSGKKGDQSVAIDKLLVLLEIFDKKPDKIPENLQSFNDNISQLSAWILSLGEQPLLLDYIVFQPSGAGTPKAEASLWNRIWMEIQAFFLSFFNDYNSIEDSGSAEITGEVDLWLAGSAGRDQATCIKTLADNKLADSEGVRLKIRLVDMDVLLRAVSADMGPDVAVFQAQSTPINYALRSALTDLTQFEDIDEITSRFSESAMAPLKWGDSIYALPEQQIFLMMFYRKDVLYDLKLSVPETWSDFYALIPTLQNRNLSIGLPSPVKIQPGGTVTPVNDLFVSLLYQNGIELYDENGSECLLGRPEAVEVFTQWTELYTKYKIDKEINEVNRFRTGEAPIVISPYTFYNTLAVAAPEIHGLWGIAPIPGTVKENGEVDHSTGSGGTNVVMFGNAKDKAASWKFMKWWTSAETQTLYGREIEVMQGASARWPTANIEAMSNLPWPSDIAAELNKQWPSVKGIPEVAGGYYVGRNIDNAIKQVINQGKQPRETILDYIDQINEEITFKRNELGLE